MEKTTVTPKGINIYEYRNEHLHSFCICMYVKAGVLYENEDNNGISHFWEHMIFKNINAHMKGEMSEKLDKLGAYFNGCTYKELVEFKITGATKNFKKCSDIISKAFLPMIFEDKDMETERKRIKSEIREDDDESTIDYAAGKTVWKGTSLRLPVAGKVKDVNAITREMIEDFHKESLTADNVFFYVTGSYTNKDMEYFVEAIDKAYEKGNVQDNKRVSNKDCDKVLEGGECKSDNDKVGLKRENVAAVPKNFMNRKCNVKLIKDDKNEIRFSFDFDTTKYKMAQIDLLYDILFDGECCKVFKKLSDESGIVYSYSSSIEQYNNIGNIYFSYEVGKKNIIRSIKEIVNILGKLKESIDNELVLAKPVYADNAAMMLDLPERLNWVMAYEGHVLNAGYKDVKQRKKEHLDVTKEEIISIARDIFIKDNLCVTIKTTDKKLEKSDVKKVLEKL